MATVELRGRDARVTDYLPRVCACCGEAATDTKEKKFVWFPPWVFALAAFPPVFLLTRLMTQKTMAVKLPVCDRHRFPWLWKYLAVAAWLVWMLVVSWAAIALAATVGRGSGGDGSAAVAVLGGWFAGIVALYTLFIVVSLRSIRPVQITDDELRLKGVSPAFAEQASGGGRVFAGRWG